MGNRIPIERTRKRERRDASEIIITGFERLGGFRFGKEKDAHERHNSSSFPKSNWVGELDWFNMKFKMAISLSIS